MPDKKSYGGRSRRSLLFAEGHAVGALILGGVCLVGAHLDLFQGTVVGIVTVIGTLRNGAGNALIGVTAHDSFLLHSVSRLGCTEEKESFWKIIPKNQRFSDAAS